MGETGGPARFVLENDHNMAVEVSTMGAALLRVELPDRAKGDGSRVNVCLNFADTSLYGGNALYAGATVAPVAGRIVGSRFAIGNKIYPLTANEGTSCLHSGRVSSAFLEWTLLQACVRDDGVVLGMALILPEDLEGFPGNRIFSATYRLDNDNCLTVDYGAVTDRDTYVNMTNHAYFNLSGNFESSVLGQRLRIAASAYMRANEENCPEGLVSVEGTPFDFREARTIRENLDAYPECEETRRAGGLDNAFDVREAARAGETLLELRDDASGRAVRIKSGTADSMVVYTGGSIGSDYALADGCMSSDGCAVALECQQFPNAVNMPELEPKYLRANESYRHRIVYEFEF